MNHPIGRSAAIAVLVVFALLAVSTAVIALDGSERTLVVADAESGDRLLEISVDEGDEVTLAYTHSVEKTPVEDVYVVDGTELRMDRMVFHSYGAGLPATEPVERTDEGFVVTGTDSYEQVTVAPGSVAGHELVVDGERYDLVDRSDGSVVVYVDDRLFGADSIFDAARTYSHSI